MAENKEMESGEDDTVCLQLQAPPGWTKKLMPKKRGTPKKNDTIFIAPTGEEISSKRQLEQYLKVNPGGPAASEFDWGSGETPRRSVRISEKVKAMPAPESTKPLRKRGRKSSALKKDNEEPETAPEGTETKDVHMDKPQDAGGKTESVIRETEHGEDTNVSTNMKESGNAKAVSEQQDGPGIGIVSEELKNEVVGEDEAKHERSNAESEGPIKEKESINCNKVQNITGVEEATRNGSNGSNAAGMVDP